MPIQVLNDAQSGVGYVGALKKKGNVVWAVGGAWGSPIVMTAEGGKKFRRKKPPESNGLRDVLPIGEKHALAVGEIGGLFETKDGESWTQIPTGTAGCLFAIERAQGSIWISGDDAFVLTSADGSAWRKPKLGEHLKELGRIQKLTHARGALWLLGYEGRLGVLKKDDVELVNGVESDTPLTAIAFSPRGVGLVVGDGGAAYRTKNKGKAWERLETGLDVDLEDVTFHDGRFVLVGEAGTLVVTDDGETFRVVETGRDEHLWCVMSDGAGVLVGGDGGLVIRADDATLAASKPIAARADEEDEDEVDAEVPEAVRLAEHAPIPAGELESASKRWIEEGTAYYDKLNAYVAQFYTEEAPALSAEPEETRKDMATFVQRAAVQLNREKRFDDLRRMFPPSYEAFDYEPIGRSIQPALYVEDGILARVEGRVHRIVNDAIEIVPDVIAFGRSRDRKHLALAFEDRIEIRAGVQRAAHAKLALPKNIGRILTIDVFPDGARALVASETGVWVFSERGAETIHGGEEEEMSYVHAALSPDGRIIACGDQDSAHLIFTTKAGRFVLAAQVEPASSYPCFAMFHDTHPSVCLSSCHFAGSASIVMDLGVLENKKKKALTLQAGDDRVTCIDDRRWMYCGVSREKGYLLGDRSGYAWLFAFDGQLLAYYHVGSTMESMDVSADDTRILFATCAGLLVEFDRTSKDKDRFHVHSMSHGREARRWVFWKGFPSLVW